MGRAARGRGLRVDVRCEPGEGLLEDRWYRFLAGCRTVLGCEGGSSVHDPDGRVRESVGAYLAAPPARPPSTRSSRPASPGRTGRSTSSCCPHGISRPASPGPARSSSRGNTRACCSPVGTTSPSRRISRTSRRCWARSRTWSGASGSPTKPTATSSRPAASTTTASSAPASRPCAPLLPRGPAGRPAAGPAPAGSGAGRTAGHRGEGPVAARAPPRGASVSGPASILSARRRQSCPCGDGARPHPRLLPVVAPRGAPLQPHGAPGQPSPRPRRVRRRRHPLLDHPALRLLPRPGSAREVCRFQGLKIQFVQDDYRGIETLASAMRDLGIRVLYTVLPGRGAAGRLERRAAARRAEGPDPHGVRARGTGRPLRPAGRRSPGCGRLPGPRVPALDGESRAGARHHRARVPRARPALGLRCDIRWDEAGRLYGDDWVRFHLACRSTLGTESAISIVDFDGRVERAVREFQAARPQSSPRTSSARCWRPSRAT